MIGYLIKRCIYPERGSSELHSYMFHGEAFRPDVVYPGSPCHRLGEQTVEPIHLYLNNFDLHKILLPCPNFIIAESILPQLRQFPNVGFAPTVIDKVIRYPFRLGDKSFYRRNLGASPLGLFSTQPEKSGFRDGLEPYWELTSPRYLETVVKYADRRVTSIVPDPYMEQTEELAVSPNHLQDFPISFSQYGNVVSAKMFEVLRSHIDMNYFFVFGIRRIRG
jgi:hypothetical protein